MKQTFQSLTVRNYRIWFVGILISNVGLWMARIAQNWIVLTMLTPNSGLAVGITIGLQFGPQLVLAPLAGFLADRYSKRAILLCTQLGLGLTAFAQSILVLTGVVQLWHVFVLAALIGVIAAVDAPSRNVFVSELVTHENLTNAVSLNSVSFNSARLIGPAFAGILIELVGPGVALAINGFSYIATIVALRMIRTSELHQPPRPAPGTVHIRDGFKYLRDNPRLVVVTAVMFVVSVTAMNTQVTIALMSRVEFGRGAGDFGLLNSAMAVGSIAGGLFAASSRAPRIGTLIASTAGLGLALAAGALTKNYLVFAGILLVAGFFMIRLATGANAYIQLGAPARVRGQVMAIYLAVFLGGSPIGAPLVGWIGDVVSPAATFWVGAIGCAVAVVGAVLWSLVVGATTFTELAGRVPFAGRLVGSSNDVHGVPIEHPETGPIPLPEAQSFTDADNRR